MPLYQFQYLTKSMDQQILKVSLNSETTYLHMQGYMQVYLDVVSMKNDAMIMLVFCKTGNSIFKAL